MAHTAVIDIGKTNAKVALVDMDSLAEISVARRPNTVLAGPPYPHYDIDGLWTFIVDAVKSLQADHGIDAITVTTHGASAVLLDASGDLAAPVLDYEHDGPDSLAADYDAARPAFAETGSPRLPMGLNLGAQLFWQFRTWPEMKARTKTILTYPQYWTYRLCGVAVNEVTSLGCHTDLWDPNARRFSSLVEREGWTDLMAPPARATDRLGTILPDIAAYAGLAPETPIYCGIHDSNASLYAHLAERAAPFAVVSTGTWVISMAIGGDSGHLDPTRDTLINVNALGDPVPSARFMGGREFERLIGASYQPATDAEIDRVLDDSVMLFPAVETQSGPFQGRTFSWSCDENQMAPGERHATVSFYLALMTATGLAITGATGPVLVEGPFAANAAYCAMLASATGRPVHAVSGTGTSGGAALLTGRRVHEKALETGSQHLPQTRMTEYAQRWNAAVDAQA